jgi:hypothetical protein
MHVWFFLFFMLIVSHTLLLVANRVERRLSMSVVDCRLSLFVVGY